jgi:hypothetical protein
VQQACPIGRYNDQLSRSKLSDCLVCPAGYVCATEGISSLNGLLCPAGSFCPTGTVIPVECPYSTYRSVAGGASIVDCYQCPSERFCSSTGLQIPDPCPSGFYCSKGTMYPVMCPSGRYCAEAIADPAVCPLGFDCPASTSAPADCPDGYLCPAGNYIPVACAPGWHIDYNTSTGLPVCRACGAGFYQLPSSNHTYHECQLCPAGKLCSDSSYLDADNGEVQLTSTCPAGYYCPTGTVIPLPCPPGTFSAIAGGTSVESCELCAADSYQTLEGQTRCELCGASSFSLPGSTECQCRAMNRKYQKSDGKSHQTFKL